MDAHAHQHQHHHQQQQQHRAVLAVDLDHTLAQLLESAFDWRNAETGSALKPADVKSAAWHTALVSSSSSQAEADEALLAFFQSPRFATGVTAAAGALETLKPLRKFFFLVAVTDRPRVAEKQTREWLDAHFAGVFDKLVFVDADAGDNVIARKKELYDDFKVKLAVGSDPSVLAKAAEDVGHALLVGSVPWAAAAAAAEESALTRVADWAAAKGAIETVIAELELKPVERVFSGPKLAKYTDDLVTVSTRKPAAFYANLISSKFSAQKQETVRLQASEGAIATAIQITELLRMQQSAVATKISTRYAFRRAKAAGGFRVPKIEVVLERVPKVA